MARARLVSARGSTLTSLPCTMAATSPCSATASAPFGPLSFTIWPSTVAVTPEGIATGFFPTRDMTEVRSLRLRQCAILWSTSKDRKENFPAYVVLTGVVIGHHTLGRREDRDPQSVVDTRQRLDRGIDPPSRFRYARNLADHRLAIEIFQLDLEFLASVRVLDRRIIANESFGFEHIEHTHPQFRGWYRDLRLVSHLRIVNTRDHVTERIVHCHRPLSFTNST